MVGLEKVFFDPTCMIRVRVTVGDRVRGKGKPNTVGARGRNWSSDVTWPEMMEFMVVIAVC